MFRGAINHLDLTVADPRASLAFYDMVLGYLDFRRVRLPNDAAIVWQSMAEGQDCFSIALQPATDPGAEHNRYSPGLHHVAFHAESRGDVDGLYARLVESGATVLDPPAEYPDYAPGYYAVFFADPDGLKLELVHMPLAPKALAEEPV